MLIGNSANGPGPLAEDREAPRDRPDADHTPRGAAPKAVTIIAATEIARR